LPTNGLSGEPPERRVVFPTSQHQAAAENDRGHDECQRFHAVHIIHGFHGFHG
jgi:hypothetical protein